MPERIARYDAKLKVKDLAFQPFLELVESMEHWDEDEEPEVPLPGYRLVGQDGFKLQVKVDTIEGPTYYQIQVTEKY